MASLETVVFLQDPLGYYSGRELHGLPGDGGGGGSPGFLDDFDVDNLEPLDIGDFLESQLIELDGNSGGPVLGFPSDSGELGLSPCPNYPCSSSQVEPEATPEAVVIGERPKRRRGRSRKNKVDMENQRMTHIAVERNRRKQMNEYLSVLRSLMPESYIQRVRLFLSLTSY